MLQATLLFGSYLDPTTNPPAFLSFMNYDIDCTDVLTDSIVLLFFFLQLV